MKKIFVSIFILLMIILGTNIVKATDFEIKLEKTREENIDEADRELGDLYDYSVDVFAYGNNENLCALNAKVYYDKNELNFEEISIPEKFAYTEDGENIATVSMNTENNADSFIWCQNDGRGIQIGNDGVLLCRLYFKTTEKKENYDIKLDFNDGYSKATDNKLNLLLGKDKKLSDVNLKKKEIIDTGMEIPPIAGTTEITENTENTGTTGTTTKDDEKVNSDKNDEVIKNNKKDTVNKILPQTGKTEIIIISLIIIGVVLIFLSIRKIKKND